MDTMEPQKSSGLTQQSQLRNAVATLLMVVDDLEVFEQENIAQIDALKHGLTHQTAYACMWRTKAEQNEHLSSLPDRLKQYIDGYNERGKEIDRLTDLYMKVVNEKWDFYEHGKAAEQDALLATAEADALYDELQLATAEADRLDDESTCATAVADELSDYLKQQIETSARIATKYIDCMQEKDRVFGFEV